MNKIVLLMMLLFCVSSKPLSINEREKVFIEYGKDIEIEMLKIEFRQECKIVEQKLKQANVNNKTSNK